MVQHAHHSVVCPDHARTHARTTHGSNCLLDALRQAQLVYEAGQIKGSIAMTHPDRIHAGKAGDGGEGAGHSLCHGGPQDNKTVAHLLEMVGPCC